MVLTNKDVIHKNYLKRHLWKIDIIALEPFIIHNKINNWRNSLII